MRSRPAIIFWDVLYAGVPQNTPSFPTDWDNFVLRRDMFVQLRFSNVDWMIQHQGGDGPDFLSGFDFLTCFLLHIKNLKELRLVQCPFLTTAVNLKQIRNHHWNPLGKIPRRSIQRMQHLHHRQCWHCKASFHPHFRHFHWCFFRYRIWQSAYKMESKHSIMWRRRLSKEPQ